MGNATITVEKISGSIDQAITLTVSGCKLSVVSSFQILFMLMLRPLKAQNNSWTLFSLKHPLIEP